MYWLLIELSIVMFGFLRMEILYYIGLGEELLVIKIMINKNRYCLLVFNIC